MVGSGSGGLVVTGGCVVAGGLVVAAGCVVTGGLVVAAVVAGLVVVVVDAGLVVIGAVVAPDAWVTGATGGAPGVTTGRGELATLMVDPDDAVLPGRTGMTGVAVTKVILSGSSLPFAELEGTIV